MGTRRMPITTLKTKVGDTVLTVDVAKPEDVQVWGEILTAVQTRRRLRTAGQKGAAERHSAEQRMRQQQKHAAWAHSAAAIQGRDSGITLRALAKRLHQKYADHADYGGAESTIRAYLGSLAPHRSTKNHAG